MAHTTDGWITTAIWWQVYPLGFTGAETSAADAPGEVQHRLPALLPWLDDLLALGCNGLLLGPVFASSTHGYDTVDHFRVDPRLGDEGDLDVLITACRERGIRVLFDGVFNHVGREHPWWREAVAAGPGSAAAARFSRSDSAREVDGLRVDVFEGHEALVELDLANPEVSAYVSSVLAHWLERGIDGWRLDAAYAVAPASWRAAIDPVRERFPEAWFVGEVIHGDYAGYVRDSGLDSVTQYELWKAVRNSLEERNLFELAWSLTRHGEFLDSFLPLTFIGNHDVTRLASAVSDERHHGHAVAVLGFVGGVPSIYSGDERGLRGVKEERVGGDDAIRPAFPADPSDLPGGEAYRAHQEVIAFRRRHPWLAQARTSAVDLANTSVLLIAEGPGGESARLALNIGDEPATVGGVQVDGHTWLLLD
ncbi:alpha-amylase family glycosyl hydrolase [Rathayibacter caricis]|uniref:alpha-amylase family glycosyl hydrolase n=1 Tax=Rathayibacter caricis TaxID=110936 RepID=UPI001FB51E46|nr:alpha-amylase family glycosyl hydrolase [Rathayibacter caricis]MCJ1695639.1 alpha-amylase family glycosyl hydrolase [Rathayibacter caricis]